MKKLANITTNYPRTIIVITLILTVFFGYFAARVTMTTNIKEFFPQDDPRVMTYDRVEAEFGGAEYIMLALEAEDLFTPETIRNIDLITRDLEQIEGVANVRSLTSVDEIKGTEWGLELSPLVQELPSTAAAAEKLKKKVLADELYGGVLVAEDASAGLIIVEVQPDFDSVALAGVIDQRIREYSIPEKLYLTGTPVLNNLLASSMQQDLKKLFPVVLLIIAVVLFLQFRDFKGVALPFATVFISLIWTLGLMGILGKKLSPLNAVMPIILVCLGNAYGIYLLNRFREESSGDKKRGAVVVAAMIAVGPAIIMAGVTTVAGFASNLFSGITLMRDFGLFTSYGVAIALMVSLTFIPAVLAVLPSRRSVQANKRGGGKTLRLVSGWVVKYPRRIIVVSFLLIVAAVFGLPRLRTDSNFFNFFPEQSQPKIAYNLVKEKFTGSESVEIVVEGDLLDPQLLAAMKGFQDDLKATGLTGEPTSLVNILERTNQAMHENNPDYKKVPDDEALIAQYLLLLEMSDDRYLSKFVTPDYGQARIQALVKNTSSSGTTGLLAAITALKEKHFSSEAVKVTETGIIVLIDALADMIIEGQISGLIFSMLAVLVILLLLLHSWQGSILSTFLIGAVTLINFGVMGWLGIPLDIVTVLISSIGVGVGIDYSIHIYSSYLEGKKNGLTAVEAVTAAVTGTGKSIISNAVAVISGFIVLVGSTFPPFRYFGILVSLIMFFAATGALLFIPAVTVWQTSRPRKNKKINMEV